MGCAGAVLGRLGLFVLSWVVCGLSWGRLGVVLLLLLLHCLLCLAAAGPIVVNLVPSSIISAFWMCQEGLSDAFLISHNRAKIGTRCLVNAHGGLKHLKGRKGMYKTSYVHVHVNIDHVHGARV